MLQDSGTCLNSEITPFLSYKPTSEKHQFNTYQLSVIFCARITHDLELLLKSLGRVLLVLKEESKVFMCWHRGRYYCIWQFLYQVHKNQHFCMIALSQITYSVSTWQHGQNSIVEKAGSPAPYIPHNLMSISQLCLFCPKQLSRWGYDKPIFC